MRLAIILQFVLWLLAKMTIAILFFLFCFWPLRYCTRALSLRPSGQVEQVLLAVDVPTLGVLDW